MASVEQLHFALTLLAILGCGLIAGVFFAFSAFVVKALARLPSEVGIAAMQSINIVVLNRWFLGVFLGTAAACVLALVAAAMQWHESGALYLLIGSSLYLVGTVLVTGMCNVPRNEALASLEPSDPDAASHWLRYVVGWSRWNHVRTAAALLAAASFSVALAC